MVWFNVDDGFYDHPKVKAIPRGNPRKGAVALWTQAGSWCGRYLTDGLITAAQVDELGGTRREVDALVSVVLWHAHGYVCPDHDCLPVPPNHYGFHQWKAHQRTREQVEAERAAARERQQRRRRKPPTDPTQPTEGVTP
jgi:hypothetical protein